MVCMMNTTDGSTPKGSPLPDSERAALLRHVRARGERQTVAALGINRQTLGRALGGLTIYPGSIALIRQGLARLDVEDARGADAEHLAAESAPRGRR